MRLFIVRHGETVWNVEGRFQGQRDTDLNEKGTAQADLVARFLAPHKFDAVVSSPLKRARVTGEKIAAACGCKTFETDEKLTEIHHGDWEGVLSSDVAARWPDLLKEWHEAPERVTMPGAGGESLADVQKRCAEASDRIAETYAGDVCVTAHDAVIKALLCHYAGAPLSSFWNFQVANCSLTVVELRKGKPPRISLMGDAHFLGEGFSLPEQKGL
jgi:probable phosphoglycerate mutase